MNKVIEADFFPRESEPEFSRTGSIASSALGEKRRILIVAAQIQADPELQRTPIMFLTALVTKAEAKTGLRIQGHPFLAKPISIPELIKGIEENLPAHSAF